MRSYLKKLLNAATLLSMVVLFLGGPLYGQDLSGENSYQLGPGDRIIIDIFGEPDLSMDVMLDNTGIINYPFLGELRVAGLTVGELEQVLIDGLKGPYLVDPDITVSIKEYRSIYVNGEVQRPGAYPYQPDLNVEKAIALAGGFTERASKNKIDVKRADDPTAEPKRMKLTDRVQPGDIITVAQSFF